MSSIYDIFHQLWRCLSCAGRRTGAIESWPLMWVVLERREADLLRDQRPLRKMSRPTQPIARFKTRRCLVRIRGFRMDRPERRLTAPLFHAHRWSSERSCSITFLMLLRQSASKPKVRRVTAGDAASRWHILLNVGPNLANSPDGI